MRIQNIVNALTSRWIIFTIITWSIVILAGGSVFTYHRNKAALKHQRIQLLSEIETLSKKRDNISAGKEQFNFEDRKLSAILSDLLSASKESGACLGETEIEELVRHDNYQLLPVTITVKGDYNQIGKFVNLLEKNVRFKILEVNQSTKETKGSGIVCKIKAEFITL